MRERDLAEVCTITIPRIIVIVFTNIRHLKSHIRNRGVIVAMDIRNPEYEYPRICELFAEICEDKNIHKESQIIMNDSRLELVTIQAK